MTNNQQVIKLKAQYGLTHIKLANLACTSVNTTKGWTCNPDGERYANVSNGTLKLLQLQIKDQKIKPV